LNGQEFPRHSGLISGDFRSEWPVVLWLYRRDFSQNSLFCEAIDPGRAVGYSQERNGDKGLAPATKAKGEIMKKIATRTILAKAIVATAGLLSISAFAADVTDASRDDGMNQRGRIEALCEAETGNQTAVVTKKYGQSFIEVYEGYRLVKADYADKDYSYSGGTLIVSYSTGPVTRGGVSLRIRAYDQDAANLEGYGHLTMRSYGGFINKLMNCYIY
jgi:hypothetical protein